jgi:hypothetical protein
MTRPTITILDARPAAHTASPGVMFRLRVAAEHERIHAIVLRCAVQIDARRRRYAAEEQQRLYELFGDAAQFDRLVRPVTWGQSAIVLPTFDGQIDADLHVPCTYDLEVASAKYLHAIRDGDDIPLLFLFTGTIFRVNGGGALTVEPIPWDVEASYRMPAHVWRGAMDQFFPAGGWLRLQRETIDRLQAFRGRAAVVTWDEAIELLLHEDAAPVTQ